MFKRSTSEGPKIDILGVILIESIWFARYAVM